MNEEYPSKLLEKAVNAIAELPGIGQRTALRLSLHLLRSDESVTDRLAEAISNFRHKVKRCSCCHNISDTDVCSICSDPLRNREMVCVVEQVQDVMAIEHTAQYNGLYHVLGGVISPVDGIGPANLEIESLVKRVAEEHVKEVILALSPTMEGDTTCFYISRKLKPFETKITEIARGIAIGDELQYADEITLGRSIVNRVEFKV